MKKQFFHASDMALWLPDHVGDLVISVSIAAHFRQQFCLLFVFTFHTILIINRTLSLTRNFH